MTHDREGERARLEAVVFGRDAAVSDAEREAAARQLAAVLEVERDATAQELVIRAAQEHAAEEVVAASPAPLPAASDSHPDDSSAVAQRTRWWRPALIAVVVVAAVIAAGVGVRVLVLGLPPFGSIDSMAVFDRPQTERDLEYPADSFAVPEMIVDSVRYLGSDEGFELYAFQVDATAPGFEYEYADEHDILPCLMVVEGGFAMFIQCFAPEEFSAGLQVRFDDSESWHEVVWDIERGITVTTGASPPDPPNPPAPEPLSVFDQEQDDADLNALVYLPDIPASQQETVRFIGSSPDGYYVAAYRDADDAVCLAVYEGGTTVVTSESVCVSEAEFEAAGIQLIYPTAAPEISVTWGRGPGLAFSGR